MISLVSDSPEPVDYERWRALQSWVSVQDNRVVIPYARKLVELIPPVAVRLRRDLPQVLNFIKTHTILHQGSRERNEAGAIISTIQDYEAIYKLVGGVFEQQVEAGISASIRETVHAVEQVLGENPDQMFVTQKDLRGKLDIDKSSISRRVGAAVDAGYLRNEEIREGKPYRLRLGDPLPEKEELLPSPDKLVSPVGDMMSSSDGPSGCAVVENVEGVQGHE
jgi:hypothetical protein